MTLNARDVALECLMAVYDDDAYANLVMPSLLARHGLRGRDAAFATELAYGTLRMQGFYDAVIESAAKRALTTLDVVVVMVLRLGSHQALAMDVSPHAAVSESVDLARRSGAARASGLVNAVMRRIVEVERDQWIAKVARGERALATRTSHPQWIVDELQASLEYRGHRQSLEALLDAHNTPAKVTLVARPGLAPKAGLLSENLAPTEHSPYGLVLESGSPARVPGVAQGAVGVQDEGSQLAAAVLASAAAKPQLANERWLDACAGPGGKTALLGALAQQQGAVLDALELHEHRADLVKQNIKALDEGTVTVHTADATTWQGGPYDRILIDAPCSGLGALRRRPEARWRKIPADLDDLIPLQKAILAHCATLLAPGGVIAYVTCSPVLSETVEIVESSGLTMIDARAAFAQVSDTSLAHWGEHKDVQLWTHLHRTDSMYVALLTAP